MEGARRRAGVDVEREPINGLVFMNVNPYVQQIAIGLILVAAVAFDQFAKSRRSKSGRSRSADS